MQNLPCCLVAYFLTLRTVEYWEEHTDNMELFSVPFFLQPNFSLLPCLLPPSPYRFGIGLLVLYMLDRPHLKTCKYI